jgi:hypothetical protein
LPEAEGEGDGEEPDGERLGLELVRVEEKIGYGKDLDRFPREPVAGEVPELAEDDEERCSRDEAGENGVRYEPGQAAGPMSPNPSWKVPTRSVRTKRVAGTSASGTGARTEKIETARTFESITRR